METTKKVHLSNNLNCVLRTPSQSFLERSDPQPGMASLMSFFQG